MAIGSMLAFPIWDDAWFWLMVKENGPAGILPSQADRPVMGSVWYLVGLIDPEFWRGASVIQLLFWIALAVMSVQLWQYFFPRLTRFGWVVACLVAAPIVSTVQMIPINIGLGQLLSVVCAYAAGLLLLYSIRATDRTGTAALLLSIPILAFGTLVTEYTLPAAIAMAVLFSFKAWYSADDGARRRAWRAAALAVLVSAAAYTLYTLVSDRSVRSGPDIHPSHVFTVLGQNALRLPIYFVSGVWHSLAGAFTSATAQISLMSPLGVIAAAYGVVVGGLLVYGSRRAASDTASETIEISHVAALAAAFLLGMTPLVAMGRVPWNPADQAFSRFELPLLPLTACIVVLVAVRLVRPQFWAIPVFVIGLVAGNASAADAWSAVRGREQLRRIGAALSAYVRLVDGGYTVAAVDLPDRTFGPWRPYELVAQLAAEWPDEQRRSFWAYRHDGAPGRYLKEQEAQAIFGTRANCVWRPELTWELRLLKRSGRINDLIWVTENSEGTIVVEPYCLSRDGADSLPQQKYP